MRRAIFILAVVLPVVFGVTHQAPAAETSSETPSVTLKWSARNEDSVYGYLVYRSERRQGPFIRINREIVHVEEPAGEDSISQYQYIDVSVELGTTYFYYLDTISKEGKKKRFSGVIKKAPDPPSAENEKAE